MRALWGQGRFVFPASKPSSSDATKAKLLQTDHIPFVPPLQTLTAIATVARCNQWLSSR